MPRIKSKFAETAVIAALTALTAVTTMLVRVPIPATNGYFNIGDVFIILAGLWLGPRAGFIAGAFGSAIADAIGFPVYIPATFIVKGFEGWITGIIARNSASNSLVRPVTAALVGGFCMVAGYYLFEAFIYPLLGRQIPMFNITDPGAAFIALLPNAIQGLSGIVGGLALWKAMTAGSQNLDTSDNQSLSGKHG
ncbi:MAG TPA: ECF transporter S component [Candidatus Ozemobacteraceae bacterium]|nr:ECF transporter S component [Candidatus Ozemobacteraceae bacterium]